MISLVEFTKVGFLGVALMPVDGGFAWVADEGEDEQPWKGEPPGITKLGQTDGYPIVASLRLCFVRPEEPVPPGEVEAVIAVGFSYDNRMVHPVHVGRNDK